MGFHNGVPITVVSGLQNMLTSTESASRRRAEEDERVAACDTSKMSTVRTRLRRRSN